MVAPGSLAEDQFHREFVGFYVHNLPSAWWANRQCGHHMTVPDSVLEQHQCQVDAGRNKSAHVPRLPWGKGHHRKSERSQHQGCSYREFLVAPWPATSVDTHLPMRQEELES